MVESLVIPRLVIAGTSSGAGKTTFTVGLCGALRERGLRVAIFKCGPDYLDPTYHRRASGQSGHNLDGWMMGHDAVLNTFDNATRDADIALVEGVMGLFDGADSDSEVGSTAEIAKWLNAPVLLVVDSSGMSRSIAAIAHGFAAFDPDLRLAGVICNRVGSIGHLEILKKACAQPPVLGGLPRDTECSFPERHLGLVTASKSSLPDALFDSWAAHVVKWCDVDRILQLAQSITSEDRPASSPSRSPIRCRIGIAMDDAFHFYYPENLRLLEQKGAELVEFSPVHDTDLPQVDGLYFGGGYPEVHAAALTQNETMRQSVYDFCASGKPVYAECGGLMYLCGGLRQCDGSYDPMVGWFPAVTVMNERLQALGYVEATIETPTDQPCLLGSAGDTFRGHQFRYSTLEWHAEPDTLYLLKNRRSGATIREGYTRGNVVASYVHAHWASNPRVPQALVNACALHKSI